MKDFTSDLEAAQELLINPATAFISRPQSDIKPAPGAEQPQPKPRHESKTARLQLLITPTLKERLKATADGKGISVNQLINDILERTV